MSKVTRVVSLFTCIFTGLAFINLSPAQTKKETAPNSAAEAPKMGETKPAPSTTPELTGAELEAFLDGMMPSQLNREDIAGAAIAVVKDGKVIFAKGYGFSDVEKRTPVTPDTTLFRPGSISKLFTWTSVMQLSE